MKKMKAKYLLLVILAIFLSLTLTACRDSSDEEPTPTPLEAPEETYEPETEMPEETPEENEPNEEPDADEPEADEVDEPANPDFDNQAAVDAYVAAMNEFIVAFEDLTDFLFYLIEMLDYIETDEDLYEWIEAFELIKLAVAISAEELTESALLAPEEYMDSHILIAAAVQLIYESMVQLDHGLDAALVGDYDTFWLGIEGFLVNFIAADMLWDEAVGS